MKVWVLLLWLLLLHPLVSNAAPDVCQTRGCSRVVNRRGNPIVGALDICDGFHWRAVCDHNNHDERTAKVMCRQLGFPEGGQEYFHSASTYARDGGYYFTCLGNETNLLHCQHTLNTSTGCVRGGVACMTVVIERQSITLLATATHDLIQTVIRREQCTSQVVPSLTQQSPCTHAPTGHVAETTGQVTETTGETTGHVTEATGQAAKKILERVDNCSALTGGLCIVTVAMAFGLVCMVSLWVRSCYRRATFLNNYALLSPTKKKLPKQRVEGKTGHPAEAEGDFPEQQEQRETYDDSPRSHPTVQNTSFGIPGMPADEETAPPYDIDGPSTEQERKRNDQVRGKENEREWQKEETVSEKVEREGASGYSNL